MSDLFVCAGLSRRYRVAGAVPWRRRVRVALAGVDLRVPADRDLALIGESGSGKSTLLRLLLGLERPDAGVVCFRGQVVTPRRTSVLRRAVGVVGQDAGGSLDPRMPVGASIREPLECLGVPGGRTEHDARVAEVLRAVELDADVAPRRPAAFSGGERQRIALARALVARPSVLVADEPFSAVDPAVRARLVALVARATREAGMRLVVVTHDLGVAEALADDVAVLAGGHLVEHGPVGEVFARPRAAATRALLDAVPRLPEVGA